MQLTRDRKLVLRRAPYFEPDEAKTHTFISKITLEELREREPHGLCLTALRGLLEGNPGLLVNLDLKTPAPWRDGRASVLADELAGWPLELVSRVWVSTFDPVQLLDLRMAGTLVPLAFMAHQESELRLINKLPLNAVHAHHSLLTAERVREWQEQGLAVFTWNVNDAALAREQVYFGVPGIIGTDAGVLLGARVNAGQG